MRQAQPLIAVLIVGLLAQCAAAGEFDLPSLDEGKIRAAGIRKLTGKYLSL